MKSTFYPLFASNPSQHFKALRKFINRHFPAYSERANATKHFSGRLASYKSVKFILFGAGETMNINAYGRSLLIRISDSFSEYMKAAVYYGKYETEELTVLPKVLIKGDRVLDIGGGIGITAILSYFITQQTVIIIEPNSLLNKDIDNNCKINGVNSSCVTIINRCLICNQQEKDTPFFLSDNFWASKLRPIDGETNGVLTKVPGVSLDELIAAHTPTAIVMDVEGIEMKILEDTTICLDCIRVIIIEVHLWHKDCVAHLHSALTNLRKKGFILLPQLAMDIMIFRKK
jgi:FkbM family methyltransferase